MNKSLAKSAPKKGNLKILVIGGGGREHALAWKLVQSPFVELVYIAPGNAGTAQELKVQNVPILATDIEKLVDFAAYYGVAFTVVGLEDSLAKGIVDAFQKRGLEIFGPTRAAAQLESSKDFAKGFMKRYNIPTADYRSFTTVSEAHRHVNDRDLPMVIKASGLAAGKGAFPCKTRVEAHEAIDKVITLGEAGKIIIIEDFIDGEEASFIVMTDGMNVLPLATSQDHKRLLDGDKGLMTGGMGAYSPAPLITSDLHARIMREIITRAVDGMAAEGTPIIGFLYAGLMITPEGDPKVLEFNCRLGDPETQPIMMRLKSDLAKIIEHALAGTLDQAEAEWDERAAVGIVLAAAGYPENPRKGDVISGLPPETEDSKVFEAGTVEEGGTVKTNGGRVVCATALGDGIATAKKRADRMADDIKFDGKQMRSDIGDRALRWLAQNAVSP